MPYETNDKASGSYDLKEILPVYVVFLNALTLFALGMVMCKTIRKELTPKIPCEILFLSRNPALKKRDVGSNVCAISIQLSGFPLPLDLSCNFSSFCRASLVIWQSGDCSREIF